MPLPKIPQIGMQKIDLLKLYKLVIEHGGVVNVIQRRLWKNIAAVIFPTYFSI